MSGVTEIKDIVNLDDLPLEDFGHGSKFSAQTGEIGMTLGLKGLGAMLHVVPPGKVAFPYHRHHVSDEMFLVLSGTGIYRLNDEHLPIKAGDCLGAPAGGKAHQIINTGNEPLRYIGFSNNTNAEVVENLDSGRISINIGAHGLHYTDATFRAAGSITPIGYWEREDSGDKK